MSRPQAKILPFLEEPEARKRRLRTVVQKVRTFPEKAEDIQKFFAVKRGEDVYFISKWLLHGTTGQKQPFSQALASHEALHTLWRFASAPESEPQVFSLPLRTSAVVHHEPSA